MNNSMVSYTINNRIATITLNRPEKRNALNAEMVRELKLAFDKAADDENVKVIVLKGNGKAFSAGADLQYLQQLQKNSYDENLSDSQNLMELFYQIYTLEKVVIAQVEGHAIAGGCGLATVCDFVFAVPDAQFGYSEVMIGFIPAIVMIFLIRKIGEARSKELLLTGKRIKAEEAKQMGMINFIAAPSGIEKEVNQFAQNLVNDSSAEALKRTKQLMGKIQSMPLEEALNFAAIMNAKTRETEDCRKGIAAFLDKRKPGW
jgi:methylglutaconyl-CoA hydratase